VVPGTIDTARLTLRAFAESDVDALYEIQGDRAHMANRFWADTRVASERWLRRYAEGLATGMRHGRSSCARNAASSVGAD
jgi:RimJ/RimL family protein N-acetyltransferase